MQLSYVQHANTAIETEDNDKNPRDKMHIDIKLSNIETENVYPAYT